MEPILALVKKHNLWLIEDCAQAHMARFKGQLVGIFGKVGTFSFYPGKNLGAYGDAGIVTTMRPEMAEHMRRLRNHGSPRRYYHDEFGWNGRIDAIQAAVLRVKLPYIADWNEKRRQHGDRRELGGPGPDVEAAVPLHVPRLPAALAPTPERAVADDGAAVLLA